MSSLSIYAEENLHSPELTTQDYADIANCLHDVGICFERWPTRTLSTTASKEDILSAYASEIQHFCDEEYNFSNADVFSLTPTHLEKVSLRQKFLNAHTFAEDEVHFFVAGHGVFYLHIDTKIFVILCQAGDLISVPKSTKHWFDMGANPNFTCIRLFSNPEGSVANFTDNTLPEQLPRFEDLMPSNE